MQTLAIFSALLTEIKGEQFPQYLDELQRRDDLKFSEEIAEKLLRLHKVSQRFQ